MQTTEASYPFKKSEVRAYNGNKGNTEVIIENPYESKIPTRFLLGMIYADSYIGNWRKYPLNFQHYDIQRAAFYIDDESIAKPPYKLDPKYGQFIEPFMELYSILGKAGEDMDIGIDPNDFVNGMFILPFDVTPTSAANMEYLSKKVVKNRTQPVNTTLCGHYCLYYAYSRCVEKINKEQIINNVPSANWIKCCIPLFFELPEIITECQCCTKCL